MNEIKPHLGHDVYASLLRRAEKEWDDEDWEAAGRFERHAVNAAVDLRDALVKVEQLQQERDKWKKRALRFQKMQWEADGNADAVLRRRVDKLKAKMLAVCDERNEVKEKLARLVEAATAAERLWTSAKIASIAGTPVDGLKRISSTEFNDAMLAVAKIIREIQGKGEGNE